MAHTNHGIRIRALDEGTDLPVLRIMLKEYESSLSVNLTHQDFEQELAELPGDYVPPTGCLLLAEKSAVVVGCIALRRLDETTCEMKRLYASPEHRGAGIGRALVSALIAEAIKLGYKAMKLDTLEEMSPAQGLYRSFGFIEAEPYFETEIKGNTFMELDLRTHPQVGL